MSASTLAAPSPAHGPATPITTATEAPAQVDDTALSPLQIRRLRARRVADALRPATRSRRCGCAARVYVACVSARPVLISLRCARCTKLTSTQLLKQRSEPADLIEQGIIKPGGNLAAQREALERSMLEDKLTGALEKRPTPSACAKAGAR